MVIYMWRWGHLKRTIFYIFNYISNEVLIKTNKNYTETK